MKKLILITLPLLLFGCNKATNNSDTSSITPIDPGDNNVLVAYFSITNHTKGIAEKIKNHLSCDIFEITPLVPYTSEDINYNTDCRANEEQNDDGARPEIKYTISDITKYEMIILGYPIWWAQAPKIMYTFIESYDFENKTILPFCTSGSSPIGSSATNLSKSAPKANWLEGKRFDANASQETINSWLDTYFKKDIEMKLYIDEKELDVKWEENDSINALQELLPLTINMTEYGGFEQTGSIGSSITRNDIQIDTKPGDIVLYNGNAISVFYKKSSWSYTRLGHINNLSDNELNNLLNKPSVTFVLKGE